MRSMLIDYDESSITTERLITQISRLAVSFQEQDMSGTIAKRLNSFLDTMAATHPT